MAIINNKSNVYSKDEFEGYKNDIKLKKKTEDEKEKN